jgi:enterochelin esterase-like enzyme
MRFPIPAVAVLAGAVLAGCFAVGDEDEPITAITVPSPTGTAATMAVVVLPGFGATAQDMLERGVAEAVHRSWPDADVLLTNATFAYYAHNVLVPHVEADIMAPARERYRKLWLVGASVGGMGAIMYERRYPGRVEGLILFAPWLGEQELHDEIRAAGGIRQWEPGPVVDEFDQKTYQREMWRVIKGWAQHPPDAKRIWVVCGKEDRLLEPDRLLATALPASHYLEVDGGHAWVTWLTAAPVVMSKVRAEP